MSSYELNFTEIPQTDRNLKTGRFLKGMTPHNKGKKWSEWMDGRKAKKVKKQALANLDNARRLGHCGTAGGRNKRPLIAVLDNGEWLVFPESQSAAKWCGGDRSCISRCCRKNDVTTLTKGKKVNDNHKHMGVRWYFESDNKWTLKIKK